jgi:hypothetical protein
VSVVALHAKDATDIQSIDRNRRTSSSSAAWRQLSSLRKSSSATTNLLRLMGWIGGAVTVSDRRALAVLSREAVGVTDATLLARLVSEFSGVSCWNDAERSAVSPLTVMACVPMMVERRALALSLESRKLLSIEDDCDCDWDDSCSLLLLQLLVGRRGETALGLPALPEGGRGGGRGDRSPALSPSPLVGLLLLLLLLQLFVSEPLPGWLLTSFVGEDEPETAATVSVVAAEELLSLLVGRLDGTLVGRLAAARLDDRLLFGRSRKFPLPTRNLPLVGLACESAFTAALAVAVAVGGGMAVSLTSPSELSTRSSKSFDMEVRSGFRWRWAARGGETADSDDDDDCCCCCW